MNWTPDLIRSLRQSLGENQQAFGVRLGYGEAGAQRRVSELETGKQDASGPLVPLLDCIARERGFETGVTPAETEASE